MLIRSSSLALTAVVASTFFLIVGCGEDEAKPDATPQVTLDGAYQAESGSLSWTSFKGDEYITVRGDDAECRVATPPERCVERGKFELDVPHNKLTLRSLDGRISTRNIAIDEVKPRSESASTVIVAAETKSFASGVSTQSTQLVQDDKQLLSRDVATSFRLTETNQAVFQEANLRKIQIICRVVGLLMNPPTMPVIVPPQPVIEAPAPVQSQQCSGKA